MSGIFFNNYFTKKVHRLQYHLKVITILLLLVTPIWEQPSL